MTALGLLAGMALDQALGDPRRGHPVALFGTVAGRLEALTWRDRRAAGAGYTAILVGSAAALGLAAGRLTGLRLPAPTPPRTWAGPGGRPPAPRAAPIPPPPPP